MNCYSCKNYSAFINPRGTGGATIYGYCFKKPRFYQSIDHKGYPVYIPEGHCKDHSEIGKQCDGQLEEIELALECGAKEFAQAKSGLVEVYNGGQEL